MKIIFASLLLVFVTFLNSLSAQENTEVFLIDNYVETDKDPTFVLSFFTDVKCRSRIILDNKHTIEISETPMLDHKAEINIADFVFETDIVEFTIYLNFDDKYIESETFELELIYEFDEARGTSQSIFTMCCIGGAFFGMPYPTYLRMNGKDYFSITKEFAVLTVSGESFNYPAGYLSLEYAHALRAPVQNVVRLGYKHIWEIPHLEFVSPGISIFTDFDGSEGLGTEFTIGLFKLSSMFTVYTRYRYNFMLKNTSVHFSEITLGLYSSFFSFNL